MMFIPAMKVLSMTNALGYRSTSTGRYISLYVDLVPANADWFIPGGAPQREIRFTEEVKSSVGAADHPSGWLANALQELTEMDAEAKEEDLTPPSQEAKEHAKRILRALSAFGLPMPSVYPTEDREVAIFFRNEKRQTSVLILCDSQGQGACFAFASGKGRRARYDDASELPDPFVYSQLLKLA